MDRRGSGLGRVLDLYESCDAQPKFESDESFFCAILPNKSVTTSHADNNSIQTSEAGLAKATSQKDWELSYFNDVVMNPLRKEFRKNRYDQILDFFGKYRYEYHFNRRNLADAFEIKEAAASAIIRKCIELGIIMKIKRDEYTFCDNNGKGKF